MPKVGSGSAGGRSSCDAGVRVEITPVASQELRPPIGTFFRQPLYWRMLYGLLNVTEPLCPALLK